MVPIENEDKKENESNIYRSPQNKEMKQVTKNENIQDYVRERFEKSSKDSPFLFRRKKNEKGELTDKTYGISYGQFRQDAEFFGKGLLDLGLLEWKEEYKNYKLRFCGIYSGNCYRYLVQDIACVLYNIVSVPIYDTLGEEATVFAFSNTNMETLVLSASHIANMCEQKNKGNLDGLKNMIIIDEDLTDSKTNELKKQIEDAGMKAYTFEEVIKKGQSSVDHSWEKVTGDDIYCFSYTSGTTGTPKGSMMSHRNITVTMVCTGEQIKLNSSDVHLNYLPMAHIFERMLTLIAFIKGCQIGLFNGDTRKLKEDLAIFKPTFFASVPRLYNKFFDAIKAKIDKMGGLKRKLVDSGIKTKLENLEKEGTVTHALYDTLVFGKMKSILGGRVRIMISASAPLEKEVADFLKICMSCPMLEAYGQTEGTGGQFCMNPKDTGSGHVGGVIRHGECKLVDVPDMKYTHKDVDEKTGLVTPRGEIWYRSPGVIPGYYKNDEKNKETFTQDGWLQSGDIGKIVPPNNKLVIIDRKKNIFKLAQGEYIAPEKLEGVYKNVSDLITDVYIYGDSKKSCLLVVLTIEKENQRALANKLNVCNDVEDNKLLESEEFEKAVLELLKKKGKEGNLNGLEIPKGIVFNEKPFADLGLLTTSFKPKRNDIKEHFIDDLNERYKSLA